MNKKKIFNDPIYGLIRFDYEILYKIIDHPYFQRLRRISQQALSHLIYPGAMHTRFQHAIGALYLMTKALDTLKSKGCNISDLEYEAACIAILLHDVGHGPFSDALEQSIIDFHHEEVSLLVIAKIGLELNHDFSLAISIYKGDYHRKFLTSLVSGQIDVDRMDYLMRDSYFSGVTEGIIGYDRIIMMMNVVDDQLVIEEKGMASIEYFLISRRQMYWQVYLHKTVISAEVMLTSILQRAKYLVQQGVIIAVSEDLRILLEGKENIATNEKNGNTNDPEFTEKHMIKHFLKIDDTDIYWLLKQSVGHKDRILSLLCGNLLERKLFKVSLQIPEIKFSKVDYKNEFILNNGLSSLDQKYFFITKNETIESYSSLKDEIVIISKNGKLRKLSSVSSFIKNLPIENLYFYCYPELKK